MAYKTKGKKQRGGYKRKSSKAWYNKSYTPLQLAQKALAGVNYIKGMINCEKHKMEFSDITGSAISNTSTVYHLTGVSQDDSDSGRTGNSILVRGLKVGYTIRVNTSSPATSSCVRVIVLMDTQQLSDTQPLANLTGLLEYPSGVRVVESPLDSTTVGRFKILLDKKHYIDTVQNVQAIYNTYIPMQSHIRYNGNGAGDIQKNGIYAFVFCDTAVSGNPLLVSLVSRLYFYDN